MARKSKDDRIADVWHAREQSIKQEARDAAIENGGTIIGTDDWKAYVAEAIATPVARRTSTQKREIKRAMDS